MWCCGLLLRAIEDAGKDQPLLGANHLAGTDVIFRRSILGGFRVVDGTVVETAIAEYIDSDRVAVDNRELDVCDDTETATVEQYGIVGFARIGKEQFIGRTPFFDDQGTRARAAVSRIVDPVSAHKSVA